MYQTVTSDFFPVSSSICCTDLMNSSLLSSSLILEVLEMKEVEFANTTDPNKAAYHNLPYLGLHCLPAFL